MKYWSKIQTEVGISASDLDVCHERVVNKLFRVDKNFKVKPPSHAELNLYTDGSKVENNVVAGYCYAVKPNRDERTEE